MLSFKQLTVTTTNGYSSEASSIFTVNPAAANKLVMFTQPAATAMAGVAFAQQPAVLIQDQYGRANAPMISQREFRA